MTRRGPSDHARELELLREGLVGGGHLDAEGFAGLARSLAADEGSPLDRLVALGAIDAGLARTLRAINKGYMRAPLGPLLASFEMPAGLLPEPPLPAPIAAAPAGDADEGDGVLGPIPEWNSIAGSEGDARPRRRPLGARRRPTNDRSAFGDLPPVGAQIGIYTLHELLHVGPGAAVFRAYDEQARRAAVIKMVRPDVLTRERDRLHAEARILARLSHPNVIRLLGSGEHEGVPYIALESLFAIGLDEHLEANGRESAEFVLQVAICAARGLGAAARAGVIHRDVKPANLLLYNHDGRVKVADFGLASEGAAIHPEGGATLRGTPAYMAPEAVVGAAAIDYRADMYGLGATLYEAASGRPPLVRATALETLRAHLRDPIAPLHAVVPGFPEPLSAVIGRLLGKRPEDRFATWSEALQTLEALGRVVRSPIADAVTRAVSTDASSSTLASIYGRRG